MATATLSTIPADGKTAEVPTIDFDIVPATLIPVTEQNRSRIRSVTFSTATFPGLIQAYATVCDEIPYFCPRPDKLKEASENPASRDGTIFFLQRGATVLNCLDLLKSGNLDRLDVYLTGLMHALYKCAENGGKHESDRLY